MVQARRRNAFVVACILVGALWAAFLVQLLLLALGCDLVAYIGLWPWERRGLWGILGAHLLHGGFQHLIANSVALLILGTLSLAYSRSLTAWALVYGAIASAGLTWLLAKPGLPHIGASGVIFALVGFLAANGIIRRGWKELVLAAVVILLYGGAWSLLLPSEQNRELMISWQMHLGGFLGGVVASWRLRKDGKP